MDHARIAIEELLFAARHPDSAAGLGAMAQNALLRAIADGAHALDAGERFHLAAGLLGSDARSRGVMAREVDLWFSVPLPEGGEARAARWRRRHPPAPHGVGRPAALRRRVTGR